MDASAPASLALASLSLTNSVFDGNVATVDGGALSLLSGAATLVGGALSSNVAGADGGGVSVKGAARAALSGVALMGNAAGVFGGAVALAGSGGAALVLTRGAMAGNTAGVAGGAAALHAPLFAMHGVLVADNAADKGGAVHVATDFAPAAAACAASAAQGLDCTAPLQDLNFTGCASFWFCAFAVRVAFCAR